MITREKVLELITAEKERFGSYAILCSQYQEEPDPLITARHASKVEALESVLKMMTR